MTTVPFQPFLASGDSVPASTQRRGVTKVANLVIRSYAGMTLYPRSSDWALHTFDESVKLPFSCVADWPVGATDLLPVQPGDTLLLNGTTYGIFGVKARAGICLTLGVEVKPE